MEDFTERLGNGLGHAIGGLADSGILFVVFAVIWLGFGAALIWSQGSVDATWQAIGDLPLLLRGVVWILFLPVILGMWIWEASWSLVWRATSVAALAAWTLLIFPKPWR